MRAGRRLEPLQGQIFAAIVFNALVLGLETYDPVDDSAGGLLAAKNLLALNVAPCGSAMTVIRIV
jgi:hypothetical protein